MKHYRIYLIQSQNRLLISTKEIVDNDYTQLIDMDGGHEEIILAMCKTFCLGYIHGNQHKNINIINTFNEFE